MLKPITEFFRKVLSSEDRPITVLLLTIGAIIAFSEYRGKLQADRVAAAYDHIEQWEREGYKSALEEVTETILNARAEAAEKLPELGDGFDAQTAVSSYETNRLWQERETEIRKLIYFFDKMAICAEREVCDADLLQSFFGENVVRFWGFVEGYVAAERNVIPGLGDHAESYVIALCEQTLTTDSSSCTNY